MEFGLGFEYFATGSTNIVTTPSAKYFDTRQEGRRHQRAVHNPIKTIDSSPKPAKCRGSSPTKRRVAVRRKPERARFGRDQPVTSGITRAGRKLGPLQRIDVERVAS